MAPEAASRPACGDGVLLGTGRAHGHHGEILQGAFRANGGVRRGLVTLPCPSLWSEATVALDADLAGELSVRPAWKTKARRAIALTLDALRVEDVGGIVSITSNIAPGRGCGSSTSDVGAAIHAALAALGRSLSSSRIARLAVAAEGASDAIFWDRPVLFAQRQGQVIEDYKSPLPPLAVLAFGTAPRAACVDTLGLPEPRYGEREIDAFEALRLSLRRALARSDPRGVSAVASGSAQLNQRYLPQPWLDEVAALARRVGAAGIQVAHSGAVGGLLFEARPRRERDIRHAHAELEILGLAPWRFDPRARTHVDAGRRVTGREEPALQGGRPS